MEDYCATYRGLMGSDPSREPPKKGKCQKMLQAVIKAWDAAEAEHKPLPSDPPEQKVKREEMLKRQTHKNTPQIKFV